MCQPVTACMHTLNLKCALFFSKFLYQNFISLPANPRWLRQVLVHPVLSSTDRRTLTILHVVLNIACPMITYSFNLNFFPLPATLQWLRHSWCPLGPAALLTTEPEWLIYSILYSAWNLGYFLSMFLSCLPTLSGWGNMFTCPDHCSTSSRTCTNRSHIISCDLLSACPLQSKV
jgi:hypothetical protein